ncbi:MAG TPA: hypothetical protein VLX32_08495, partial [Candidatus Acidoferrum sp.]|nr:hypothetical protein [Candidatus Acidoferrum sp.]
MLLALRSFFLYPSWVMRNLTVRQISQVILTILLLMASLIIASPLHAQEPPSPYAPVITKI